MSNGPPTAIRLRDHANQRGESRVDVGWLARRAESDQRPGPGTDPKGGGQVRELGGQDGPMARKEGDREVGRPSRRRRLQGECREEFDVQSPSSDRRIQLDYLPPKRVVQRSLAHLLSALVEHGNAKIRG